MTVEEISAAMTAIVDGAANRDLTDEEVTQYEGLEAQLQSAQRTEQVRARQAAYAAVAPAVNVAPAKVDDTQERAFVAYMRTGKVNGDLVAAQSEGTGSEGGYLVPDGFRNKLIERMKDFGGLANVVEEITTATGNNLPWPTVDDTANVGEVVEENGTFTGGADIVFGEGSLGAWSYMAGGAGAQPLRVSLELTQDAEFDIQGLVARKLGERIARIQAPHLVTGTGVKQPQGITTGLTGIEIAADTAGITYDDLVTFIHSVDKAYRAKARWGFNDNSMALIEKIKDSHGDPIWRPADANMATNIQGGSDGTLLGYPVTIDAAFPDLDADANTVNWGVFGDLREGYVIRRVRDVQLLVNPYSRMAYRQVEFTAWARMDAVQQNTNAYVALTGEQ